MAGFAARTEVSQGIHDDLYASMLLLEKGDTRAVLVTLDLIGLKRTEMIKLREIVGRKVGVSPSEVMIACSHTHSGPSLKPNPISSVPIKRQQKLIDKWLRGLRSTLGVLAEKVSENLVEAKVKYGKGYATGLSYNRRKSIPEGACMLIMETGRMRNAVREQYKAWRMPLELIEKRAVPGIPTGSIDPEVLIVKFETTNGNPIATLINFSCHPVTLGPSNLLISADYPGYLRSLIEEAIGGIVLFTQGASGDVRPFYSERTFKEAERIGMALASIVLRAMNHMEELPLRIGIKVVNTTFELPLREIPSPEEAKKLISEVEEKMKRAIERQDFQEVRKLDEELIMLKRIAGIPVGLPPQWLGVPSQVVKQVLEPIHEQEKICELQALAIGDVILAAIPGELFVELGLEIKKRSWSKRTIVVTLANGSIGYIPTKKAYEEGGYETRSLLKPGVGEIIVDRMIELIEKLKRQ